jgi:hypothetical protein
MFIDQVIILPYYFGKYLSTIKNIIFRWIVAPQPSGGRQHNYSTKTS